ncbi:mechanosensitive ion channel [Oxalobacteraceae bacterium OM1]|nr:mechanosensitive ion channel [Oxalobacteraceae bacterium OM1]
MLWQILVLAICLGTGAMLARVVRTQIASSDVKARFVRLGVESFARVLSPLLALLFIVIAKSMVEHWIRINLLRIAIPLVGSFALIRFAFYILRRIFARGGGTVGGFVLVFEKVFAVAVWAGVALYVTGWWPDVAQYLDQTVLPIGRNKVSLLTIAQASGSVIVTLVIALWVGAALEERLMRMDSVHSSLRVVMARMVRAILILLAVLLSLSLVGIDLTVLSVFGGALGVGLGLGLQKIVSNYVSGFVILIERSLALGDMVTVDKYTGLVTRINTRYTIVRSLDGVETVIPNEMLLSGAVQNHSLTDRVVRLATRLTVAYRTDIDQALKLLEDAARSVPRVVREPAPQGYLIKFDPDGFELELGFWIADPENGRSSVLSDVNRAIWKALQGAGIDIPYPQREVRILESIPRPDAQHSKEIPLGAR